jgi:hypothetical protein
VGISACRVAYAQLFHAVVGELVKQPTIDNKWVKWFDDVLFAVWLGAWCVSQLLHGMYGRHQLSYSSERFKLHTLRKYGFELAEISNIDIADIRAGAVDEATSALVDPRSLFGGQGAPGARAGLSSFLGSCLRLRTPRPLTDGYDELSS